MIRLSVVLVPLLALVAVGGCKRKAKEAPAAKKSAAQTAPTPAAKTAAKPGAELSWSDAVKSADPKIRAAALADTPVTDSAIPGALIKGLDASDADVRKGAIRGMLGFILKFSDASALRRLLKLAEKDADPGVRFEAVTALGSLSHRAVLPRLMARYRAESDKSVREAILGLAARSGDRRALPFLRTLAAKKNPPILALDGLRDIETKATPALLRLAEKGSPRLRARAIEVLGEIGDASATPQLEAALGASDLTVVRSAVDALARLGSPSAVAKVLKLAEHADADIRAAALMALGGWGADAMKEALPTLVKHLSGDKKLEVRVAAAQSLGRSRLPGAISALEQAAGAQNPSAVRSAAIDALGQIGDPRAVPLLVSALELKEPDVRTAAARALGLIRPQGTAGIPALIAALKRGEKDLDARAEMLRTLGRLDAQQAAPLLEKIATTDPVPFMRIEAASALLRMENEKGLAAIQAVMKSATHWEERREAARALEVRTWKERREAAKTEKGRAFAGKVAALTLEALETEKEPMVREVLYTQLGRMRGPEAAKVQRKALGERVPFFRLMAAAGLCRTGDAAGCQILIKGLSAPQSAVRVEAARRIGWYKVTQAKAALKRNLADPVVYVSGAARAALARLEGKRAPKVKKRMKKL